MDGERTNERQYSEYSGKKFTQREPEYDRDTDRHRRKSTQVNTGYDQDTDPQQWELLKSREKKFLDKESNPMYFEGVRTIRKSDLAGPQGFDQPWPDGPDGSGPHIFTNTAVPRCDGTRCWQQHLLVLQAIAKPAGVVCAPGWGSSSGGTVNAGQK